KRFTRTEPGGRTEEVLCPVLNRRIHRGRRGSGPNREAGISFQQQFRVRGIKLDNRHWGRTRSQRLLRDGIDLSTSRVSAKKRIFVRRDVDAVRVGADLRIVGKTRTSFAVVLGSSLSSIILSRNPVDVPKSEWIGSLAHGEIEMIGSCESKCRPDAVR